MNRHYVSEFTHFIDDFLEKHPEVVRDQKIGRSIYWDKHVDLADLEKARQDSVPEDGYGFYSGAWARQGKQQGDTDGTPHQ